MPMLDQLSLRGVRRFLNRMDSTERARYLDAGGAYEIGATYGGQPFPVYVGDPRYTAP